jgi:hypothetical protein
MEFVLDAWVGWNVHFYPTITSLPRQSDRFAPRTSTALFGRRITYEEHPNHYSYKIQRWGLFVGTRGINHGRSKLRNCFVHDCWFGGLCQLHQTTVLSHALLAQLGDEQVSRHPAHTRRSSYNARTTAESGDYWPPMFCDEPPRSTLPYSSDANEQ